MEAQRERLLEEMEALASVYTPEWQLDREDPDAGTAIAMICAGMFAGVRSRYARLPEKHRRAFFNELGLTGRAATPAEGYVTFGLSGDEFGGYYLPEGAAVSASLEEQVSVYRTAEPLYVTPARLVSAYLVDKELDYMGKKDVGAFAPFACEEENLREHCFYLSQDEVLEVSGEAEILLTFSQPGGGCDLSWLLGRECSFSYLTGEGFVEFAGWRQEDGRLVLSLVDQGQTPVYGELFGTRGRFLCCRYEGAWNKEPFQTESIRMASRRCKMEPDLIWNLEGGQENHCFLPFGREPMPFAECYLASAEALGKAGARISVSFALDYEKIPFDNSVPIERKWKKIMRRSDFVPDPEYDITVESVVWEYYNGSGWSRLFLGQQWERAFCGSGAGTTLCLEFLCPKDVRLLEWQAAPTRYLRIRILRMNNLYKPKGTYIVPVMRNVRFSYEYETDGELPMLVASVNNREQRCYDMNKKDAKVQELFFGHRGKERALYLGFHRPLTGAPLRFLCSVEKGVSGEAGHLLFSCSGEKGFFELSAVDGTKGFTKNGTITLAGSDRHRKITLCGETLYWLRVTGGGENTARCHVYLNAARAVAEENSFGKEGNCPPQAVTKIGGSYGYVNSVTNPLPFGGGEDMETLGETLLRGSAGLFHGGRAITASDFEALAMEASRSVEKVKCTPGCNGQGEHEPGSVVLVLLLKQFLAGSMYFENVREQVFAYLHARMSTNPAAMGHLYLVEPLFLEMDCEVEAVVAEIGRIYKVQEAIREVLTTFLNPVTGNYDGRGWDIGVWPKEAQITNALKKIPGLLYIRMLRITAFAKRDGKRLQMPVGGRDREAADARMRALMERFAVVLPGQFFVTVDTE